ncbi:MAG TPA: DUF4124 domain-containing protein [Gammaproteobacteria bacterium]|nr:DUF4124 domain-containing protein [Gammaproteobacteria bacterium]
MRASIALLLVLALGPAGAVTLYKWVDEDGVRHFSDQPHPGAEVIELEEAQTFAAPRVVERTPDRAGTDAGEGFSYQGFWVATPRGGQTLWNIEGNLGVALSLTPALQPGHRIRVFLDGELVEELPDSSTSFTVPEVYRGTHTLRATVVDAAGNVIAETEPITFYVHQTSILSPARQNR